MLPIVIGGYVVLGLVTKEWNPIKWIGSAWYVIDSELKKKK